jgi:hypothetical protein
MAQTTTLTLLPETAWYGNGVANIYDVFGNQQPAASYYLASQSLQTINISCLEVTGNISIQATLVSNPAENDWFETYRLECNAMATANTLPYFNSNAQLFTNITGSYVWMRAVVYDFANGAVQFIKMAY